MEISLKLFAKNCKKWICHPDCSLMLAKICEHKNKSYLNWQAEETIYFARKNKSLEGESKTTTKKKS